jgi:hypothetical protein
MSVEKTHVLSGRPRYVVKQFKPSFKGSLILTPQPAWETQLSDFLNEMAAQGFRVVQILQDMSDKITVVFEWID